MPFSQERQPQRLYCRDGQHVFLFAIYLHVLAAIAKPHNFPRNTRPNFAQYISERPEMTFHGGKPKKVKTTKEN
jgi:hypothetical protein